MNINEPYKATFTRERFLFYEMRIVSQLIIDGLNDDEIIEKVYKENLFQYPSEKSIKRMTKNCLKRLSLLENQQLIKIIANGTSQQAKQVCLYAMMNQYRVIYEFMVSVIGEKYRSKDYSFSKSDISSFFMRLQQQSDIVASWSEVTIARLKMEIMKILIENQYLDNHKSESLNDILIDSDLKQILIDKKERGILLAFNCFEGDNYEYNK